MKKILTITAIIALSLTIISCEKDKDGTTTTSTTGSTVYDSGITFNATGTLTLALTHTFGAQPLEISSAKYTTQSNDTIKVTQLSYYISNIQLTTANGTKVSAGNYHLITHQNGKVSNIILNNIPAGRYTGISYIIGVDSLANSTGVHTGDLDPSFGMYWTWNTGYVFFRLKGQFSSQNTAYSFDIGGDRNTMNVPLSFSNYKSGGTSLTASVNVDVARVFNAPNIYNMKADEIDIHDAAQVSIPKLKANISNAFTITGIQ